MTSSQRGYSDDLRLAHVIADQVDAVTMSRFGAADLEVTSKPDLSPVTDADRSAEELVRAQLSRTRSRDAIIGEEMGTTGSSPRQWVVDPIDGTKNFVRGVPVWATIIGLIDGDDVVVGLVSAPSLGRRWWASAGAGAWTGRSLSAARQLRVSKVSGLADASLSYSDMAGWAERGRLRAFMNLAQQCWRTRAYGDFWSYMLLAEGAVDIATEPELALHDMVGLVPIVTEAGGRFTSLEGVDGPFGADGLATNGLLHTQALETLNGQQD